jgi:4-hydroxy-tetrahydrodipicolinate synthase
VTGTTGEFSSLSIQERKKVLEVYLRDKKALEVMCQVGTTNLPETLELLQHATEVGADSVLVTPPFYYKKLSVEGLARFYYEILEKATIPVLLYHIPQVSAVEITHDLLRRLTHYDKLYGIKDSSGRLETLTAYIREFPKLRIFTGSSRLIGTALRQGCAGAITGNGNLFAAETAAVFKRFREGKDLSETQARLDAAAALIDGYDLIPAMKFAFRELGLRESYCRPPLANLSTEDKQELKSKLGRLKVGQAVYNTQD